MFEKKKELIKLKGFKVKNKKDAFYPPILDENPTFAARFLTIEDSNKCYEIMKDVYVELQKDSHNYPIIEDSMYSSYETFMWFAEFFKELERLKEVEEVFEIPYYLCPKKSGDRKPQFQPPFHVSALKSTVEEKFKLNNDDPINRHRVNYIKQNHELEEFRDGFPAWYLMQETTVFENYNAKTNVRVRIDFRNGEFQYFISGASDNWQPIYDVPLEMDDVVSAILFRN